MNNHDHSGTREHGRLSSAPPVISLGPRASIARDDEFPMAAAPYLSLAACWRILQKRRWTVFTTVLVVVTVVAIISFRLQPVYRATARIQVEAETPLIQSVNEVFQKSQADDAFLQTQIQVLKSESLAWRTIEQLGLSSSLIAPEKLARVEPDQRKVNLIAAFEDNLSVELVPKTRMLLVSYEGRDARLAAQAATALANNYLDYNFRQKYDATRQASGWMEQQLDELKAKVEQSQQALVGYERQNQIVNTGEKQSIAAQTLSELSHDLTVAESDRLRKESVYREVVANRAQMAALAHNELLQKLEEKAADLRGQYTEAIEQYGPKFPKAERLHNQIRANQTLIEREQDRVIERIRKDYETALSREKLASGAVAAQQQQIGKLNQLLVQHNLLQRDFETNQQLYQSLLQRLKDATVSAGLRSTNIHIVDPALPPTEPIRPRKLLNIAASALAGLILGMIGAFVREGLDHSLNTAEELEALLSAPVLAVVPFDRKIASAKQFLLDRRNNNREKNGSRTLVLTAVHKPQSELAEAYRMLRTAILLSVAPTPKLLLISSAQAGEGKTRTALNLAHSLAQRKGPVLILDCDLRKGSVALELGVDNAKGLSTVLTGTNTLTEALQSYGSHGNLWVLPSGPAPENPAELLSSEAMAELCAELAARFEHVIIDSPPVLAVTDATILSSLAGGVILVAESGVTPRGALVRTQRILETSGARILGVALNKVDLHQRYSYSYYPMYRYYGPSRNPHAHPVEDLSVPEETRI